ncbi:MAG TPA: hypothetical protein ENF33_02385 [Nitrososphaeria archaeon]|nr:MAG: hypothetical protein DRN68_04115 [Nitrososphaerota archaeon]HDJ66548.1 hypothetical protein [Nitrososphaeria archaeon]
MADLINDRELEKTLEGIEEDLRFCEENLKREIRLNLTRHMLEELMRNLDDLRARRLPRYIRKRVEELALKIKILYHRAEILSSLKKESRYYRGWRV